ncbi:MAG: UDP-3-O-[3-hydroxymyristoyl] N-acetylglucosamine deacetylase [Alphaproteobacteria bacterium]|nr:UDP-3-O-[3-hydroxymyristoyl] N-acetylglucosamine deacetylase [Alphaproteobacteria bacterium]
MVNAPATAALAYREQHTLAGATTLVGTALHSGLPSSIVLRPARADSGIGFRRIDIADTMPVIDASWRNVIAGDRATVLGAGGDKRVSTVEHLLAALAVCGVDNAVIDIDGPEPPALDGSAAPIVAAIDSAGLEPQAALRRMIEVLKPVAVSDGDRSARLEPMDGFSVAFTIDYPGTAIGSQSFDAAAQDINFRTEICPARTFCLGSEIDSLRDRGLGLGGTIENTVVVEPDGLRPGTRLRFADEFVRHKILDCLGDLSLLGHPLAGRFEGLRSGHDLTHSVISKLMADRSAWRVVAIDRPSF